MTVERLLYGKNETQKIVSIEVNGSSAELFIEDNGVITSQTVPNRYWMLAPTNINGKFVRLKGDLYYKYGVQFTNREEFQKHRMIWKSRNVFSIYEPKEAIMVKDGYTYFKGLKVEDVSVLSFDLETTGLNPEAEDAKVLLISSTYRSQGKVEKKLFAYDDYETEAKFLEAWCDWVREKNPSVLLGHNISTFDIPYLKTIAEKHGTQLKLGRDGSALTMESYASRFRKEAGSFIVYNKTRIYGREVIDTLFLSIKHDMASRKYENYGLKNIIKQEGLEKSDRVFYDASKIRVNYKNPAEWSKIKAYCSDDSDDSLALYDLMIKPFFYVSQIVPKPFQTIMESATGSQLNVLMMRSYLQDMHSIPFGNEAVRFEGAISYGKPGVYKNAFKVDVSSLYPSIITTYDVYDEEKDPNKHFLTIVKALTDIRLEYKKLYKDTKDPAYDAMSGSLKILINSAYGFLGASGLNFNSPKCASFITRKGREILQTAIVWATGKELELPKAEEEQDGLEV